MFVQTFASKNRKPRLAVWRSRPFPFFLNRRPKRDGVRKHRPASDGAFTFSSLFCVPESTVDGKRLSCHNAQWASVDADPWGAGQDLPSLLQKVAIKDRRASEGAFGDSRSGPRKRVDLFSSLRLRRKGNSEETEQEAQHDIQTILSNFRNKGWCSRAAFTTALALKCSPGFSRGFWRE